MQTGFFCVTKEWCEDLCGFSHDAHINLTQISQRTYDSHTHLTEKDLLFNCQKDKASMKGGVVMKSAQEFENEKLVLLCDTVRTLYEEEKYEECFDLIYKGMNEFPHAAEPHNLLGILLEKSGDHVLAMKHFRAAWALDPTFKPANHNLHYYGTFFCDGKCAFDESDLPELQTFNKKLVKNEKGIGRWVSKNKIEYDENGVGHITRG